jgi:electron transfer flavoprotein beta subunit
VAWATGNLPEPPNNPQIGMAQQRTIMPALQRHTARWRVPETYLGVEMRSSSVKPALSKTCLWDDIAAGLSDG